MLTTIEEKDQDRLLHRAALHLCEKLREALAAKKQVNVAVPGGRNVAKIFQVMQGEVTGSGYIFIIDERLVPIDHRTAITSCCRTFYCWRGPAGYTSNAHPFYPGRPVDRGASATSTGRTWFGDIILLSSEDGHVGTHIKPSLRMDNHHGFVMDDS
jgi:6-phosphogluconolactonase